MFQDTIRDKIYPMISQLMNKGTINWYHFLYRGQKKDQDNAYFHIRFSVTSDFEESKDIGLPEFCDLTKKIGPILEISGIDRSLLKDEKIEEAWRIMGEQSEWVMSMLNGHKEDVGLVPIKQIIQFMHYFMNMFGLVHKARFKLETGDLISF